MENKITIYTDGAARGNPGPAGWGVVIFLGDKIHELGGRSCHATNNQMELTAPIEALKYLKQNTQVYDIEIMSDSKYVILGITEWIFNWQKNNWRNAAKKPVVNQELWEELYDLTKDLKIKWAYVKGHSGDKWNDRVDEIATSFADDDPVELKK
ncbi:ribonuclease HI [Candidatus Nomurabacteria bacterium]|nr:ribonuclease HI [Candidatus Nomurabacteria bacterium]